MEKLPHERLNLISKHMPSIIYSADITPPNYQATFISHNIKQILGFEPIDFLNNPSFWIDHVHPEDKEKILKDLEKLYIHDHHVHTYRFRNSEDIYLWFNDHLSLLRDESGNPKEIFGSMTNITEQIISAEKIKALELKEKIAEQRVLLIQDMHDGFGSELAVARILASEKKLNPDDFVEIIESCILDLHLVVDTLAESNISLKEALINFKYRLEKISLNLPVKLKFDLDLDLDLDLFKGKKSHQAILNILRILKEAVSNALKHSKASTILVSARFDEILNQLIFTVKDNGSGFLLDQKSFGRGLNNMKSRSLKLQGQLNISTNSGTEITLVLPLN